MARQHRANAELEALQVSAALDWDSKLGDTGESSSLSASLARVAEEVENLINTTDANGVWWWTQSTLVAILSHLRSWMQPFDIVPPVLALYK
jgi:hypothetical protein